MVDFRTSLAYLPTHLKQKMISERLKLPITQKILLWIFIAIEAFLLRRNICKVKGHNLYPRQYKGSYLSISS